MLSLPFILIIAVFIVGLINRTRSIMSGRKGYPFFQPLRNVNVLLHKASVYSTSSTIITRLAAPIYLACTLTAAAIIPLGTSPAAIHFPGDIMLLAILLAAGRLAIVLGAFDSGSPFQGMGASRELLFGLLGEPAFYLLMATLAMITGFYSLSDIFAGFNNVTPNLLVLSVVVGYGVFKLSLAECGRVPVDDTRTHLELTMIHEAIVLDLSGVDLAFVQIAGWIKLAIFGTLMANALTPAEMSIPSTIGIFIAIQAIYAIVIGVMESFRARNKMAKNAIYLTTVSAVGILAIVVAYLILNGILN